MFYAIIGIATGLLLILGSKLLLPWLRRLQGEKKLVFARAEFRLRREHLEAKFFELASESGRPRGLQWKVCDFEDEVVYARDRKTGNLAAMVPVTISFTAIEGGGMEDVEAVGNLRAATAVFQFVGDQWMTEGRALFNLNPEEAVEHFGATLEMIAADPSHRASSGV